MSLKITCSQPCGTFQMPDPLPFRRTRDVNSGSVAGHRQQHQTSIPNVLERKTESPRRTVALACTLCYCPSPPPSPPVYPSFRPAGTPQPFPLLPTPRSITLCLRYTCNLHPSAVREVQSTCEVK